MSTAVVIPSYKVSRHILSVISRIPSDVASIYVVDDRCPEGTGKLVQQQNVDPRVKVIFHNENLGVGGATVSGLMAALNDGHAVGVKIDGDGQMDPALIQNFLKPIEMGQADFTKGNRFHSVAGINQMPWVRLIGNAGLSFMAKATTGYWTIMDPTNGYFAIHLSLLPHLETKKLARRYFFENDLLFRLGLIRAVVRDVPLLAHYGDEVSNLSVSNSLITFPSRFASRFVKRIAYLYFVRDFSVASILLVTGGFLFAGGIAFGAWRWILSFESGLLASSGTVMLAALPITIGFQMLLFALLFDVLMVPKIPIHPALELSFPRKKPLKA